MSEYYFMQNMLLSITNIRKSYALYKSKLDVYINKSLSLLRGFYYGL